MKVGIKYCGGCNPRYDRAAYVKVLCARHPDWDWEYAQEGVLYDLLLVVGGCTSCCAGYDQYQYKRAAVVKTGSFCVQERSLARLPECEKSDG